MVEQQVKEFETLAEVMEDLDALGIQGMQRYRVVNQFLSLKARYSDTPISGTFELTPLCNLDCKMCYVHLNANQLKRDERLLTLDEWKVIARQCVDAGMLYVTLTGGECLTYPQFKELYLYIVSLGIQPDVMTNGRLLTDEMIEFFVKYPPGVMQISLYGSCEDAYEKVTGHRACQQVLAGIERAKNAGLNLTLAITPNRFMQEDASALLDLVHSLGLPYSIGGATLQARPETQREILEYAVDMDAYFALQDAEKAYIEALPQNPNAITVPRYYPIATKELKGLPCGGAHSSFHVNWKGELCPCIAFAASVHYSLTERGFPEAWRLVRETMETYRLPAECSTCKSKEFCISCPGEKCMSDVNGRLNRAVCQRLELHLSRNSVSEKNSDGGLRCEESVSCAGG